MLGSFVYLQSRKCREYSIKRQFSLFQCTHKAGGVSSVLLKILLSTNNTCYTTALKVQVHNVGLLSRR